MGETDLLRHKVNEFFNDEVMGKLTDLFGSDKEFSLLGVGEGHIKFHFLKSLRNFYPSICNVAVEPNNGMLQTFKDGVDTLVSDGISPVRHVWFNSPLSQSMAESPIVRNKYNIISSIHSMYHLGDFETSFNQLASLMKDKGLMIIVCKNENLMAKIFNRFTWFAGKTQSNEQLSSKNVQNFAESNGYDVTNYEIFMHWDITDVFDDQSEFGNKLLDFFTQVAYFR
nr:carnosine N-methyltransferase 2-like [Lytechinus pictus]